MASTYVNDLRLNELATGDASGSWGTITNTNLELIAEAFSFGTEGITTNADTHTTTIADGATDPGRSMFLKYTGTLDSACTITIGPNTVSKLWFIENGTSGSQNIIIKQGSGATITIPPGDTKAIYSDGAGSGGKMVDAFASLSVVDLKVQDDLTVTDDVSIGGDTTTTGTLTVGVDDTGYDVKFFGDTASAFMLWDASADDLILGGAAGLSVNSAALVTGVLTTTAATVFNGGFASNANSSLSNGLAIGQTSFTGGNTLLDIHGSGSGVGANMAFANDHNTDKFFVGLAGDTTGDALIYNAEDSDLIFGTNNAEAARFDSTGSLLIGNTDGSYASANADNIVIGNRAASAESGITFGSTVASSLRFADAGAIQQGIIQYVHNDGTNTDYMNFNTQATERMRITTNCVGFGVIPEAWGSNADAIQLGNTGMLFGQNNANVLTTGSNFYWDNTDYKRIDADLPSRHVQFQGSHIFNHAVTGSADTNITWLESFRVHPTGQISIGTSSAPTGQSMVLIQGDGGVDNMPFIEFQNSSTINDENLGGFIAMIGTDSVGQVSFKRESSTSSGYFQVFTQPNGGSMIERLRINASGNLLFGDNLNTSAATNDVAGVTVGKVGNIQASVDQNPCLFVNRKGNDGTIVSIRQAGSEEGTISVSGSTVSYNAFSGSHWSRLTDNSQPTILKGTLIETIDEMCDWYQAQFTIPATTKVNEDGTVEDVAAYTVKEPIALPDGASVGDTISHISNGVTYSATIVKESDNKHTKCKISDTADSLRVYGVFAAWDGDDDTVNDMYVTAVGTHVVRIHGGQTVSAGDLLVSNGDGTAKVQEDDIIRSKTLGKVLTNIKQETYADNSYTVPCALYCG